MSNNSSHGYLDMDLLRFTTAGSVDDGKSTLIGRLLYDSRAIFDDQMEAVEQASSKRGSGEVDLSLLTDGLRAEREQGITIDVAYRYFATPKRKFIIADTPGHIQYTRNMVTGASTANLAIILVDARKGIQEQTNRHAFIASLLGIPHVVFCINKMDLVDYDEAVFKKIQSELEDFSSKLEARDLNFIPISALKGDNVVHRSARMDWYQGSTLMYLLENIHIAGDLNHIDRRFPVQHVIRPMTDEWHDFRGFAGQITGGIFRTGDAVQVLPSGFQSTIKSIHLGEREVVEAFAPQSVVMALSDEIDISRGDMIVSPHNLPHSSQDIDVMLCWLNERPLQPNGKYAVKHTTRDARCMVKEVTYKMDINTLRKNEDDKVIGMNDIGRVQLRTTVPLHFDNYTRNRNSGSLILIDEGTNETVAAGMIL
ncbi:MAG: GTP-binding protein [Flavobacteriales bacterium]|jgi:sulfate adenylyltransferase subunit 1|nr:GTP-binding protein [Flavobacteriales bacterium]MBK7249122.1 GTP-binding protein [Flavobacteriales bacterium]MBK7285686.1 GTP-binding protein [Flavobacteriales bacterium]MBK9058639.1 GTP-binding protein [Flavobacteriales bacterium]QQS71352.1 MAG: GTP-binding protein [Flavobacteriales bacterium]